MLLRKIAAAGVTSPADACCRLRLGRRSAAELECVRLRGSCRSCSTADECQKLASLYPQEAAFPQPHSHGAARLRQGRIPLFQISPARVDRRDCATALYAHIVPFANAWNERMNIAARYPNAHADYLSDLPRRRTGPADAAAPAIRARRLSIACIRICMANSPSRCRSPSCSRRRTATLPAANSC